jgi:AcrR family transcriptional regulator
LEQKRIVNEDLRASRTRKRIQEALIELTVEKGYDAITVQDIVNRASINRSTFYRHYLDKADLLSKYMDEVTGVIFKDDFTNEQGVLSGLIKLLNHIQTFSEFYRIMLSANGHPLVSHRLRQKIESHFLIVLTQDSQAKEPKTPQFDMRLKYISAAGIGAILWWVENNTPCTSEELVSLVNSITPV